MWIKVKVIRFHGQNIKRIEMIYIYIVAFPHEEECVSPDIIDSDARVRNADVASRIWISSLQLCKFAGRDLLKFLEYL